MSYIQWKNRLSNEKGFVKSINRDKGYFEATKNITEAKEYKRPFQVRKDLEFLVSIGENERNELCEITREEIA